MNQPAVPPNRASNTSSQILMCVLPVLHNYAENTDREALFFEIMIHWLTPKELRPNPLVPHPEERQEAFVAFVQSAKAFAKTDEQIDCLNAILHCRSTLDFGPGDFLLGGT